MNTKPEIGMGATIGVGSDRYPYTVVGMTKSRKTVFLQADNFKLVDGEMMSEHQVYEFSRNETGEKVRVTLRRDGSWRVSHSKARVHIGDRRAYRDPCF